MGDVLKEGELEFDFTAALKATHFDDENHEMSHCMKAVDFLVEWPHEFWFVEVKDPSASSIPMKYRRRRLTDFIDKMRNETLFSRELAPKLKDSFLYLHLSGELPEKPLKYVVLLAMDNLEQALLANSMDHLKRYSCILGPDNSAWCNSYIEGVAIFNEQTWNRNLTRCPVIRRNH